MNNQETNHIYPIFDRMLGRADKEELLKQHGLMIWFTGLSGSGKSTIAIALERELQQRGLTVAEFGRGAAHTIDASAADPVDAIMEITQGKGAAKARNSSLLLWNWIAEGPLATTTS